MWDDPTNAQKLMKALSAIRHEVEDWQTFQTRINDVLELAQLEDESFISDITNEIEAIEKELSQKELHTFLSGKYDRGNALLAIHAGAGGTESQDLSLIHI